MTGLIGIVHGIDAIGEVTWRDCRCRREIFMPHRKSCTRSRIAGGGHEWESPKAGASAFSPSFEDGGSCRIDDIDVIFGKHNFAALVGERAQADEGMGK
jgi:hypothetical protein